MLEIRFHGRGGQGAVTCAELVAKAAIAEGKYAQAFPSFGAERRGAPVMAFLRVADEPIRLRQKIYTPDVVVVLDPTLLGLPSVVEGLKEDGLIITNASKSPETIKKEYGFKQKVAAVDATKIALDTLRLPITNTTMLGALIKRTQIVGMEALSEALEERFGRLAERNKAAMERAFKEIKIME
ncbi:MAG: pyruvate ferredoxin oxidoreductase subunit gamma [Candidatus Desulfofervidaceae bacterium]|nr:pyruvate ferredoxin oxidoreductase subunit gamma [Candidatus Desulfofervidaceae bacterium]MDL1970213.1 pyruvate ferredoxin oxidoreductase subunit gamma [Candidatus Desulfofervidaceae bacterium]